MEVLVQEETSQEVRNLLFRRVIKALMNSSENDEVSVRVATVEDGEPVAVLTLTDYPLHRTVRANQTLWSKSEATLESFRYWFNSHALPSVFSIEVVPR